ncbi:hypothetical protein PRZ48_013547 [Zasmidium cellare]|uniref:Uncharacterized protein n=1 Tax=Zasmidium cellare TaxID=395010 RepID=A0ABR0E1V5_ZASCE|nr:hypothetical protein PRZ48_013547 [Zasmidium cellare]
MANTAPEKVETKAQYGPLQSKEIFRDKWLSKFRDLVCYASDHAQAATNAAPLIWDCHIVQIQIAHVTNFSKQARQLSLTPKDFPEEPEYAGLPEDPTHVQRAALIVKVNPFEAMKRVLFPADLQLYELRKCKNGSRVRGTWQTLPLEVRQRMNDLFETISKAEEEGWWPLNDGIRERWLKDMESSRR